MATIASRDPIAHPPRRTPADSEAALAALDAVRERTLTLVAHLDDEQLSRQHSPIMSPLVWDLGHIAAYEDLWLCHRHGGLPLLRGELAELYDAFETPRAVRGEIELLGPEQARSYLVDVRERTATVLSTTGVGDGTLYELVLRHELQHTETMLQAMRLAELLPPADAAAACGIRPLAGTDLAQRWVQLDGGEVELGAHAHGFSYDNERPRHTARVPGFQIARLPLSNAEWAAAGGAPRPGEADAPVCNVSWHEAESVARALDARLPSEEEWETAATQGALALVGRVWEWTSSELDGYPGFVAHPYREYSEVFFGHGYKVLRGGSWATHPRVKTLTFRNWDLPIREQIFAGVRLARDIG